MSGVRRPLVTTMEGGHDVEAEGRAQGWAWGGGRHKVALDTRATSVGPCVGSWA